MVTSSEILLPRDLPAGCGLSPQNCWGRNVYTIGLVRLWSPTLQLILTLAFARVASMRAGFSPIAVRLSLCVSFPSKTRGSQNIRVCRSWFVEAIGLRQRIRQPRGHRSDRHPLGQHCRSTPIIESSARVRGAGRTLTRDFTVCLTEDQLLNTGTEHQRRTPCPHPAAVRKFAA